MREISAYKTADGLIFEDEDKAAAHEIDLIGAALDGLISHVLKLDVTQSEKVKAILPAIKERKALKSTINLLHIYMQDDE